MVTIEHGRIARIEAVVLDRATLEAANFISETSAELAAERVAGRDAAAGRSSVDVLRQYLP